MPTVSSSSQVEDAQKILTDLQESYPHLPPDCQSSISADLEHIAETLNKSATSPVEVPRETAVSAHPLAEISQEFRMGMVLRKAHAGIYFRDLVNKTVRWSPEIYDLLGLDPSTPNRSETFMGMIHPDDRPRVERDTLAAIEQGGTFYQEFRIIRPDGETIWLSSIGYVELDANGLPLALNGVNQDITPRKAAEQAREQARHEAFLERKRLLEVMEALPIGVAILNTQAEVVRANQKYQSIWGGSPPSTSSIDDFAVYRAWNIESQEPVLAEDWAAAKAIHDGATVVNQYLEIERFDGTHCFVLNSAAPIFDEKGGKQGCVVAIRDISDWIEAKRALQKSEQALRESEVRLRVALSSLPITAFMLDRDLRYTWVYNPQHGMTEAGMLGRRDDEIYHGKGGDAVTARLRLAIATGQGFQWETKTTIFGEERCFLLSYEPFQDESGQITGLVGAGLDITAQRRLEQETREALRQVEQQREIIGHREKERQEIAREIHDGPIQTLVSMMFDIQLVRGDYEQSGGKGEVQQEFDRVKTHLRSAVRELRDVVNNLRPPALLRFGLGKTLQVYVEDFREKHPDLDLDLLFDLPDEQIYFSENANLSIYRLCQEGLNNIARHARASKASIRFSKEGAMILLEIKDNGRGFQVPTDLLQKTQEGHFGLAGMKERVGALGGDMNIQSSPQAGTTVRVIIPLEQPVG